MLLEERDTSAFKQWVLPKLESISDADAGVLADYVIALVSTEASKATIKQTSVEALSDFLHDHTRPFVDDVVRAIEEKGWMSRGVKARKPDNKPSVAPAHSTTALSAAPIPSFVGSNATPYVGFLTQPTDGAYDEQPRRTSDGFAKPIAAASASDSSRARNSLPNRPSGPSPSHLGPASIVQGGTTRKGRKRKHRERDAETKQDVPNAYHEDLGGGKRPKQTARRGGKNNRGVSGGVASNPTPSGFGRAPYPAPPLPNPPVLPVQPDAYPPLGSLDPMAFLASMAAALGVALPDVNPLARARPHTVVNGANQRCKEYDTNGICLLGNLCPYKHGGAIAVHPDSVPEYDPNNASLALESTSFADGHGRGNQGRGRNAGRGKGSRIAGRARAAFSQAGPSYDRTNATVVVEQIPDEHLSDNRVRGFFKQFGEIVEIQVQVDSRLAIVRFEDHDAAQRAYDSPKVIFDNRFVKVYWYKLDSIPARQTNGTTLATISAEGEQDIPEIYREDENMINLDGFRDRQAEYQKAFEERRKKAEEAAAKAEEIDRQLWMKENEIRSLRLKLLEIARAKGEEEIIRRIEDASLEDPFLLKGLSQLDAGSAAFYAASQAESTSERGRGGFRGRYRARGGFYSTRGRGAASSRGGYRPYSGVPCGVKRLDNRPRRLAVATIEAGSKKDEALRQYLLHVDGCEDMEWHMERPDTLVLSFQERYMAEMFIDAAPHIPNVDHLELSWVPNDDASAVLNSTENGVFDRQDSDDRSSTAGMDNKIKEEHEEKITLADLDFDVAADDEWL